MGYIGNSPEYWNLSANRYSYTATEGQTTFQAIYDSMVDVYLNGVKLQKEIDYIAEDSVTVSLTEAAFENDVVDIIGYFNVETFDITKYGGSGSGMNADLLDGQHGSYYTPNSQFASHTANTTNPHSVTAVQVGLGSVNNTSDTDKPVSVATQTALDAKVDKVAGKGLSTNDYTTADASKVAATSGTNTGDETATSIKTKLGISVLSGSNTGDQDLSGYATTTLLATHADNTNNPHSVTATQVGLGNCNNTSDANKPISTAQQTAFDAKQATLVSGTNIKTINGSSLLGSGNINISVASVLPVITRTGSTVTISTSNGYISVLDHSGSTITVPLNAYA